MLKGFLEIHFCVFNKFVYAVPTHHVTPAATPVLPTIRVDEKSIAPSTSYQHNTPCLGDTVQH